MARYNKRGVVTNNIKRRNTYGRMGKIAVTLPRESRRCRNSKANKSVLIAPIRKLNPEPHIQIIIEKLTRI